MLYDIIITEYQGEHESSFHEIVSAKDYAQAEKRASKIEKNWYESGVKYDKDSGRYSIGTIEWEVTDIQEHKQIEVDGVVYKIVPAKEVSEAASLLLNYASDMRTRDNTSMMKVDRLNLRRYAKRIQAAAENLNS